jgi:hypothetical protein
MEFMARNFKKVFCLLQQEFFNTSDSSRCGHMKKNKKNMKAEYTIVKIVCTGVSRGMFIALLLL